MLEATPEVAAELLYQAARVTAPTLPEHPNALEAHRWRYARPQETLTQEERVAERALYASEQSLCVVGDWIAASPGGGVEAAYRSGVAGAARLLGEIPEPLS